MIPLRCLRGQCMQGTIHQTTQARLHDIANEKEGTAPFKAGVICLQSPSLVWMVSMVKKVWVGRRA